MLRLLLDQHLQLFVGEVSEVDENLSDATMGHGEEWGEGNEGLG